jgi:hypothetical protein
MVLPSSALLNCTALYLTSFLPHSGHVTWMTASFFISLRSTVWIADRFCRKREGKEEGFVVVVMVFEVVSTRIRIGSRRNRGNEPLFSVPQHSHFKIESLTPLEGSSRLPQSVQKTRDPIADILMVWILMKPCRSIIFLTFVNGSRAYVKARSGFHQSQRLIDRSFPVARLQLLQLERKITTTILMRQR